MGIEHGGEFRLDEPWRGYEQMSIVDVLTHIQTADDVQLSLIHIYETTHQHRRAILDAVEARALELAN